MNDDTDQILIPGRRVASRLIGGRALLLDPAVDRVERLNEVGSFIWSLVMERRHTQAQVTERLVERFEVSAETATEDLVGFLEALGARGLVTSRPPVQE